MADLILVTGVSGFIAKHVAFQLLQKGYAVRGTIRALNKADQVKRTLSEAGADISNLEFAAADLSSDDGWDAAADGCINVLHIASPLPTSQPRHREALVPAARDGALRVLNASRNAERIIMTSSIAAMGYKADRPAEYTFGEDDWSDPEWRGLTPYAISKTRAEKAAWDAAIEGGYKHRLTVINPGFVFGPALDDDLGASIELVRRVMTGDMPGIPPISFATVDVRDVADLHIRAMEMPETGGRRLIAAGETLALSDMAEMLREEFPDYADKIPTRRLSITMMRIFALFNRDAASISGSLGLTSYADAKYVTELTGQKFRSGREALLDTARSLIKIKAL
ncbi:MAG: aldehyde reductase [Marinicaulis sp.]|nr:aldehyde reductase [Marinicaulis sp.]